MPSRMVLAVLVIGTQTACHSTVPLPVTRYATVDLPPRGRSDGAYASLTPELRQELVLQDATAACSVDVAGGTEEAESHACACSNSSGETWEANCQAWIGGSEPAPSSPEEPDAGAGGDAGGGDEATETPGVP